MVLLLILNDARMHPRLAYREDDQSVYIQLELDIGIAGGEKRRSDNGRCTRYNVQAISHCSIRRGGSTMVPVAPWTLIVAEQMMVLGLATVGIVGPQ